MIREVKNTLSGYQKALEEKLPHSKSRDSFGDECIKFKKEKDRDYVCYCINTAAYIAEMIPQLEQMAKNLADEKVRDSMDLQTDLLDDYYNTVSYGIKALVNGEYGKVENILYSMTSMNWATFEDIGDQSGKFYVQQIHRLAYVTNISSILCEEIPAIRNLLSRVYFRNFCDRLVMQFLPRFLDCVSRCKRVNEMSAQQMLLDLHSLKTLFMQLPTVGQNETDEFKYVIPPTQRS